MIRYALSGFVICSFTFSHQTVSSSHLNLINTANTLAHRNPSITPFGQEDEEKDKDSGGIMDHAP